MKKQKFEEMTKSHPWLADYITYSRYSRDFRSAWQMQNDLKDRVRRNIKYVAFRPWSSLDLSSRSDGQLEKLAELRRPGLPHEIWRGVRYQVLSHANRQDSFSQCADNFGGKGWLQEPHEEVTPTICEIMEGVVDHYLDQLSYNTVNFDAVIRWSYTHSTIVGHATNEVFEVYLCPDGWIPEFLKGYRRLRDQMKAGKIQLQGHHNLETPA